MLTIRLTRKGRKNQPFFRIVVIDKRRSAKGGRAVEILGYLNPLTKKKSLKKDRILYWISKGAQPSATVHNLLISEKIIEGKKIHIARVKKGKEEQPAPAAAPASSTGGPASQTAEKPAQTPPVKKEEAEAQVKTQ